MKKMILDDSFQSYLVEGAQFTGDAGIPVLMDLHNAEIPNSLIPFTKIRKVKNKRQYVHFYVHDRYFANVLTDTRRYVDLLKQFDGVVTPDPTMFVGNSKCLLETSTYMNRAVGFYLQKQGIPIIPNVRWTDDSSFEYCFLCIPQHSIVAISTHGCCRTNYEKKIMKSGLAKMIEVLKPSDVIVHGYMPDAVFDDFAIMTKFHRYPSEFELTHQKHKGADNGAGL